MAKAPKLDLRKQLPDRERIRRSLPQIVILALALFAVFAAWQTWVIYRDAGAAEAMQRAQQRAMGAMTAELAQLRSQLTTAMRDPELIADLAQGDVSGRAAATARAYKLVPKAQTVQFFSATLEEVVNADYTTFGYAKAAQLMSAQNDGRLSRFQTDRVGGRRVLTVAAPVIRDQQRLGYVWLTLPFATLQQDFNAVDPGPGRLELRQTGANSSVTLMANGSASGDDETAELPIPNSALTVVAVVPHGFIVLPRPWPLSLGLALGAALSAVLLAWFRRRRTAAPVAEEGEPTLADVTREPAPNEAGEPAAATTADARGGKAATTGDPGARVSIDRSIFRAYDIRGVVGSTLDAGVARLIGQAVGSVMLEKGLKEIVVGRDGRLSGPDLASALGDGLREAGIDVIDIGAAPTPVVYFAAYRFNTGCCVAVTGSHNPPDYNGFKIVIGGETLAERAIQDLYVRIAEGRLEQGGAGNARRVDVVPDYIERVAGDVQAERPLKVVADAGNGIAGSVAPQLLEAIGCEVVPLYCEVDGEFPNHHPDPSDPANLGDLIVAVKKTGADLGLAFDGDGDRLGVVTPAGEIIYPDRLLMLFAQDVLLRQPGATVIYDVKCTGHLQNEVLRAGGSPLMWRTGHSLIKAKMRETDAALAGEMSGHFFFGERWYGFDDGIYAAARLVEIIAGDLDGRDAQTIFATLPQGVSTPELKIEMEEGEHYAFIDRFREKAAFEGARLTTIDGVRADWKDGWGLVRASNTTPVLVLRFDADNGEALARIQDAFRRQILALEPGMALPF
jgi:phosphomannomutase / phosphoglucomutase